MTKRSRHEMRIGWGLAMFTPIAWFRMVVGGLILYFRVMPESGPWTVLFLALVLIGIESQNAVTNELSKLFRLTISKFVGTTASRIRAVRSGGAPSKRKWS